MDFRVTAPAACTAVSSIFRGSRRVVGQHVLTGNLCRAFVAKQFGGTVGGPIKQEQSRLLFAFRRNSGKVEARNSLSAPIGTPCPVSALPTIIANEALINSEDCRAVSGSGPDQFLPHHARVRRRGCRSSTLSSAMPFFRKWIGTPELSQQARHLKRNYDYSKSVNRAAFDVATCGDSANGIEG